MLFDDLKEMLKGTETDIKAIKEYWHNSEKEDKYQELHAKSLEESFWQHKDQASILQSLQKIKLQREAYETLTKDYIDLNDMLDILKDEPEELIKLKKEITHFKRTLSAFKLKLLLNDSHDDDNCFLTINAGAGGTESQDWASMLLRMYLRFCEREKLLTQLIDYQAGEAAGIKSATLFVKGNYAYGLLKSENGIHRLVRISPFDANKRRHTSFAAVSVIPELPKIHVALDAKDLRIDTYRAGGAGGQHVNKTDSAVRITHIPTGLVVQCQNERSQLQNKETALKVLKAKLLQKELEEQKQAQQNQGKKKIEWGSQIRSYILQPYQLVKDHRTGKESGQPSIILDGDLLEFIESYLIKKQ